MDLSKFLLPAADRLAKSRAGAEAMARMMGGTVPEPEPDRITVAPVKAKGRAEDPWAEGIEVFSGRRPEEGYRDNAAQRTANFVRGLLGMSSGEDEYARRQAEYQAAELAHRKSAEIPGGTLDEVASVVDPDYARKRTLSMDEARDFDRKQRFQTAVAAGDLETAAKIDPIAIQAIQGGQDKRDEVRRAAASRMVEAAKQIAGASGDFAGTLQKFAAQNPGVFTPEELQIASQGGAGAVVAALQGKVQDDPFQWQLDYNTGKYNIVYPDGRVVQTDITGDMSDVALRRAQAAKALGAGDEGGDSSTFDRAIQRVAENVGAVAADSKTLVPDQKSGWVENALATAAQIPIVGGVVQSTFDPEAQTKREMLTSSLDGVRLSMMSLPGVSARLADTQKEGESIINTIKGGATLEARIGALYQFAETYVSPKDFPAVVAKLNSAMPAELIPPRYRPQAAPAQPTGGGARRYTPEEARQLPKGTVFIGTDGVARRVN